MKKVIPLILALVMCLSLCACGGQKYVGTYTRRHFCSHPKWQGQEYYGTETLVLNKDGTGKIDLVVDCLGYIGKEKKNLETPKTAYNFPITWEVVGGYLYIKGEGVNEINEETVSKGGTDRFNLVGKTLQMFSAGEWYDHYTKTE